MGKKTYYDIITDKLYIRRFQLRKFKICFLVAILLIFVYLYFENTSLITVDKTDIVSNKIDSSFNGYKILQLSDLHSRRFGKNNKNLIKKIDKIDPDIIVCTGDMMNSTDDEGNVYPRGRPLRHLHEKLSCLLYRRKPRTACSV